MRIIVLDILVLILILISLALVIGISLGVGWVLSRFLPFSLFEATLLGMFAAMASGMFWYKILRSLPPLNSEEEEDDSEVDEIPETRFWRTSEDRTWANWIRYMLANSIYEELLESPRWTEDMVETQLQELAIRLSDVALGALRAKSFRDKRLRVNREMLRQAMVKSGQRPYENDLLDTAVTAVNMELTDLEAEFRKVIRGQLWDKPAEVY